MKPSGLTGRVIASDGKDMVVLQVGRATFTIHNIPEQSLQNIRSNGNDLQHLSPTPEGTVLATNLSRAQQDQVQQRSGITHGGR